MDPSASSGKFGILVARAWAEPAADDGIRIRVSWAAEATRGTPKAPRDSVVVDSREALLAVVANWFAWVSGGP